MTRQDVGTGTQDRDGRTRVILAQWQADGIRNVRFELPDMHGTSRSKLIPIQAADHYVDSGLNMYGGTVVLDARSDVVSGTLYNEEVAYGDQRLFADPSTAEVVPWAPATARFICDAFWPDGRVLEAAPRRVFTRVLDRAHALGYEVKSGIEQEFYLLDATTREPLFGGHHIFNTVRNTWHPAVQRIVELMPEMGIPIVAAHCEYSGSQWEINFAPQLGVTGPDHAFSFKNAVKEIARQDGLLATFMSKPIAGWAGSGAHNHMSLMHLDGGRNALADPKGEFGLSSVGRSFIAGQLKYAAAIDALLAPTVNCLRRRRRHTFSPTNVSWGPEDRSALIRLKAGDDESRHVENRAPSGLSNPYLATAALLGAGILGIEQKLALEPPAHAPAEEDPSKLALPSSLEASLAALEADSDIRQLLGDEFVRAYVVMRQYELGRFGDHVTDWEREEYLEIF